MFGAAALFFKHARARRARRPAIAEHALIHQGVRGIEHRFDLGVAVALLAGRDIALGESEIFENAFGIGPLLEEIIVLEEMIVAEGGVRDDDGLHRHGIFFEKIGDARVGIDHHLIRQAYMAGAVEPFLAREQLAEGPVVVHQRHAHGRIGVQHLLGGDDLDLVGIDVELQIVERDLLHRLQDAVERLEAPFGFGEERRSHSAASCFLNSSWKTGKMSTGLAMRLVAKFFQVAATLR